MLKFKIGTKVINREILVVTITFALSVVLGGLELALVSQILRTYRAHSRSYGRKYVFIFKTFYHMAKM